MPYLIIIILSIVAYNIIKPRYGVVDEDMHYPQNRKIRYIITGIAIAIIALIQFNKTETPGHWNEKADYEAVLMVNAFPSNNSSMNYRVPALISASVESDDSGDKTYSWTEYTIKELYIKSNRKILFDSSNDSLQLGETVYVIDEQGNDWNIELTNKRNK